MRTKFTVTFTNGSKKRYFANAPCGECTEQIAKYGDNRAETLAKINKTKVDFIQVGW